MSCEVHPSPAALGRMRPVGHRPLMAIIKIGPMAKVTTTMTQATKTRLSDPASEEAENEEAQTREGGAVVIWQALWLSRYIEKGHHWLYTTTTLPANTRRGSQSQSRSETFSSPRKETTSGSTRTTTPRHSKADWVRGSTPNGTPMESRASTTSAERVNSPRRHPWERRARKSRTKLQLKRKPRMARPREGMYPKVSSWKMFAGSDYRIEVASHP